MRKGEGTRIKKRERERKLVFANESCANELEFSWRNHKSVSIANESIAGLLGCKLLKSQELTSA